MDNPIYANGRSVALYFAIWLLVIVVHAFILYAYYSIDMVIAAADSAVFNLIFAGLGIVIWFVVLYSAAERGNWLNLSMTHFAAATLLLVGWWLAASHLLKVFYVSVNDYVVFLSDSLVWRCVLGALFYFIFILIYYLTIYYRDLQHKELQEAELKGMVKEAELDLLKFQLNPHFIFNSLNSISSLTVVDPEKARGMIITLSSFLRYAVSQRDTQEVKLIEELANIDDYLSIEKIRFGELLHIEKQIAPDAQGLLIPNLILQPLIENAIKHGVYEATETITIVIKAQLRQGVLQVKVFNTIDPDAHIQKGAGMGLKSIKDRLRLLYDQGDLLTIISMKESFEVTLSIPQNER